MKVKRYFTTCMTLVFLASGVCLAQDLIIYPAQGQSEEQMDKDKYECFTWAKQQSGFDPTQQQKAAAPPPPAPAPRGGVVRGAARGALIGVTVGAIAGDAGKGAGIGAAAGGLGGGMKQVDQQRRQDQSHTQQQQQQAAAYAQNLDGYNRANAACLEGRGYSVK